METVQELSELMGYLFSSAMLDAMSLLESGSTCEWWNGVSLALWRRPWCIMEVLGKAHVGDGGPRLVKDIVFTDAYDLWFLSQCVQHKSAEADHFRLYDLDEYHSHHHDDHTTPSTTESKALRSCQYQSNGPIGLMVAIGYRHRQERFRRDDDRGKDLELDFVYLLDKAWQQRTLTVDTVATVSPPRCSLFNVAVAVRGTRHSNVSWMRPMTTRV